MVLRERLEATVIPGFSSDVDIKRGRKILADSGLLVIPSVVSDEVCDAARQEVLSLCGNFDEPQDIFENEQALFQVGTAKLKGYYQLSNYPKAVVNMRNGQDDGMFDIFNCDRALPNSMRPFREIFEHSGVLALLNRPSLKARNLNVYVNRGVRKTRGFHVDSYSENLKAFIYMTDVLALDDGPYTFVKRSHLDSGFRQVNKHLCKDLTPATETPILDPEQITPVLAPKGSLVISDQSGSHRGWPQSAAGNRLVAVMKYS